MLHVPAPTSPEQTPLPLSLNQRPQFIAQKAPFYEEPFGMEHPLGKIIHAFERHVPSLYPSEEIAPYHSYFNHALPADLYAQKVVGAAREAGIEIDGEVVHCSILGHDIFNQHRTNAQVEGSNPRRLSTEELSAHHCYRLLKGYGAPEEFARKVEACIVMTHVQADVQDVDPNVRNEATVVRYADLFNLMGDFKTFERTSLLLHRESMMRSNKDNQFGSFATNAVNFLAEYLKDPIELEIPMLQEFHKLAVANIVQGIRKHSEGYQIIHFTNSHILGNPSLFANCLREGDLIIGNAPRYECPNFLDKARELRTATMKEGATLWLPHGDDHTHQPNEIADSVIAYKPRNVEELAAGLRTCAPHGVLFMIATNCNERNTIQLFMDEKEELLEDQPPTEMPNGTIISVRKTE